MLFVFVSLAELLVQLCCIISNLNVLLERDYVTSNLGPFSL